MIETISHYKILKKLGAGGMGEVYLAEDQKLARKVALKILPAAVSAERKWLNRFLQEARLAANLNHPHICTIYEINESAETPFLAMELVEGETLAEKIHDESLKLPDILEIAAQIADALGEAHRSSIIHRDIKSSNVIINRRGQVKVLDFGLAKIISEEVSEADITRAKTDDGMLVGTVQYMSPEHALGKKLDGRTDLWSLGVLLYEMACGTLPFKAATHAGTFDEILHKQPAAPNKINSNIPTEFGNIIFKLLEKDRDFRYQTASDLLADLKRLRRSMSDVNSEPVEPTTEIYSASNTEILSQPNFETPSTKKIWLKVLSLFSILLILGSISFAVWRFSSKTSAEKSVTGAASTRLTNLGKVYDAVISPDGNYIAYITDDGAKQSLWIKQTTNGSAVQIAAPPENIYQGLAISPDNKWIYYNTWDRKSVGEIFRVPALGGGAEKIVHDCMPGISVSHDGRKLAFIRSDDTNRQFILLTINADGSGEREIHPMPETHAYSAVWSPDDKTIAFGIFESDKDRRYPQIVEIPAEGGDLKVIWKDEQNNFQPNRFIWLADKSGFLVTLSNSREFQSQIWRIDYADGSLRQITKDLNSYSNLSATADGKSLLSIQQDYLLSVWIVPTENAARAARLTEGKMEGVGLSWTPDNHLVYASSVTGNSEIWTMKADGTERKQLTSDKSLKLNPCVTGDGKHIFHNIVGNQMGGSARIDINGKNSQVLENKWNIRCASASPQIFYFAKNESAANDIAPPSLVRDSIDFNAPVKVTEKPVEEYAVSPDGKSVAYIYWDKTKKSYAMETQSIETGAIRSFALPETAFQKYSEAQFVLRFTADSKNLSFINDENGFANVWLLPLNGEKPRRVTNFNDNFIFSFAWANDGKNLAVSRGTLTSDAILFKQPE